MTKNQSTRCASVKQRLAERHKADKLKNEREKVVGFFLNLYNAQSGGTDDAPIAFRQTSHRPGIGSTYELRVQHVGKWVSRPMGINPIGEENHAKSTCYKVIYDDVLVVKIPSRPIVAFEKYIEQIKNERKIAARLEPDIKCIVPVVSPILKNIPAFFNDMRCLPEEVEEKSIERLKHFPRFQEYLKIGEGFAFFMDISKHSFLLQVLDAIFESQQRVQNEIIKQPEIISKFQKFEERYGIEKASVWLDMQPIVVEYQELIDSLVSQNRLSEMAHDFRRRQWFLSHLAKREIDSNVPGISADFFSELDMVLGGLSIRYASEFQNYREMVEDFVRKESFKKSRLQISDLVTGLLRLLAELSEKKTAIRDLKPENIFFAADSFQIALSPARRQDVCLGLIDLETAVSTECSKVKKIEQPLLGGTPSYATPSNFVPNILLEELFRDVARILHIQDWHACVCMIYFSVTGETLFQKAGNSLFHIIDELKKSTADGTFLPITFKKNDYRFWKVACDEFKNRTEANKRLLDDIEILVPCKVKKMFLEEAMRLKKNAESVIEKKLKEQTYFKDSKSIDSLLNSSPIAIRNLRQQWGNDSASLQPQHADRKRIVLFLKELEKVKHKKRINDRWVGIFNKRSATICAYDLLCFMFEVVTGTFFQKR